MAWARVWTRFTRILNFISDISDAVIFFIVSRMVRDDDEFRRRIRSRTVAKGFLILDVILTIILIFLAAFNLNASGNEMPTMHVRFWIVIFMTYCMFHIWFSIIRFQNGPWLQIGSTMLNVRNLEDWKNAFGILWSGVGMFFVMSGTSEIHLVAPKLIWILTLFLCFDVALAICCMVFLFTVFILFCCCVPILCVAFYYVHGQEHQGHLELPPCPWCHKQQCT